MKHIFSKRAPLAFAAFCAAAAIASCKSDSTGPSTPAAVAAQTTPPATAIAGVPISGPSVIVTDASGAPVAGVDVNFAVAAGSGAVQYPFATTGPDGVASAGAWQIGGPGVNTVTATVEGLPPVSFSTTAQLGSGTQIVRRFGDNQLGHINTDLPIPLTVQVLTAGGIGISGQTVTFTVATGGGSIAGSPAVTDAGGFATPGAWTLGPNFGTQTVVAQFGTFQTTFTVLVDPCEDRTPLAVGQTVNGTLAFAPSRCAIGGAASDRYSLTTPGAAVSITLASSAFDALVNVSDSAGTFLAISNDNDPSGGTTNSAITRLIVGPGMNTLTATSATAGATGAYTLAVASASAAVTDCATPFIAIGATTQQTLTTTDCTTHNGVNADAYRVFIPAGVTVRISQSSNPLDALIELYSPSGTLLVQRDNLGVSANSEVINFTAITAGFYKIVATSYGLVADDAYGAEYGAYTLSVVKP